MADFNAGEKVPVVHYNFRPYVDWSGELTEPSFDQINEFRQEFGELSLKAVESMPDVDQAGFAKLTMKAQAEIVGRMLDVDNSKDQETVIATVVKLTELDEAQFRTVPWRIQQAFYGHLVTEYLRPEAPGTTVSS